MNILNLSVFDNKNQTGITKDAEIFSSHKLSYYSISLYNISTKDSEIISQNKLSDERVMDQLNEALSAEKYDLIKISYVHDLDFLIEILAPFFQKFPDAKYVLDLTNTAIQFNEENKMLLSQFEFALVDAEYTENLGFDYSKAEGLNSLCPIGVYNESQKRHLQLFTSKSSYYYNSKKSCQKSINFEANILTATICSNIAKGKNIRQACKDARKYLNSIQN